MKKLTLIILAIYSLNVSAFIGEYGFSEGRPTKINTARSGSISIEKIKNDDYLSDKRYKVSFGVVNAYNIYAVNGEFIDISANECSLNDLEFTEMGRGNVLVYKFDDGNLITITKASKGELIVDTTRGVSYMCGRNAYITDTYFPNQ